MEDDAVVEPALGQRLDLLRVLRREVRAQADGDAPILGVEIDGVLRIGRRLLRGGGRQGGKRERQSENEVLHGSSLDSVILGQGWRLADQRRPNFSFSRAATSGGTKRDASPPMPAIWRTSVAVIGRASGDAGRMTVCTSGAIVSFMAAICIS